MKSEENEMDLLELTFCYRGVKRTKGKGGHGCPVCGEKDVLHYPSGKATYACGFSQGGNGGDTPCKKNA